MAKDESGLCSPMQHTRPSTGKKGALGTYNRHRTPVVSQPRSVGKDAQPEKFFEDLEGSPAALSSPMGTAAVEPKRPLGKQKK